MPNDARADRPSDHETDDRRGLVTGRTTGSVIHCRTTKVNDEGSSTNALTTRDDRVKLSRATKTILVGQHRETTSTGSGRQLAAALAATGGQNRAPSSGTHAQAEAVRLRATAVVWLEGPLAHGNDSMLVWSSELQVVWNLSWRSAAQSAADADTATVRIKGVEGQTCAQPSG
jgi:hypothetical protein